MLLIILYYTMLTSKEHWKTVNNIINKNVNKHNIT